VLALSARWRQENYFKYAANTSPSTDWTATPPSLTTPPRLVPNPAKKQRRTAVETARVGLAGRKLGCPRRSTTRYPRPPTRLGAKRGRRSAPACGSNVSSRSLPVATYGPVELSTPTRGADRRPRWRRTWSAGAG